MNENEIISLIKEMLKFFGGAICIIVAFVSWLSALWQKRILQQEQNSLMQKLESHKHQLSLAKSSYDNYLDKILEYYNTYYKHYRLCQRACTADAHRQPDGSITSTQDDFDAGLDQFLQEWSSQEGKIRILLPDKILAIHERSITAFNHVRDAVYKFKKDAPSREKKLNAFEQLNDTKCELETALRSFLRTEELLK